MKEKVMALIDWVGDDPYLITVCRNTPAGNLYIAFEVYGENLEPYEAYLNGPENPVPFEELEKNTLKALGFAANKVLEMNRRKGSQSSVTVN